MPDQMVSFDTATEHGHGIQFSGMMISPDEELTAAHGVESWDIIQGDPAFTELPVPNTNFVVTQNPADTNARDPQPNGVAGVAIHYNDVSTTPYAAQGGDFAIIKLAHPVTGGFATIDPAFTGGDANFSGYSAIRDANGNYVDSPLVDAPTTLSPFLGDINSPTEVFYGSNPFAPGASGGAVWIQTANGPEIVGVEDGIVNYGSGGTGLVAGINYNALNEINYWQAQDGEAPAVVRLYNDLLGRAPDSAGLQAWSNLIAADTIVNGTPGLSAGGTTYESAADVLSHNTGIIDGFLFSSEFVQAHPDITDGALVTLLYNTALGRTPDLTGLNAWVGSLENHVLTPEQVVVGIVLSTEALQHAPVYG